MTEPASETDLQRQISMLVDIERNNRERSAALDALAAENAREKEELRRYSEELDARSKAIGSQQQVVTERERSVQQERSGLERRREENVVPMKKRLSAGVPKAFSDYSIAELNSMIEAGRGGE